MADETKWREVTQDEAEYGVVIRVGSYDTSVCFYKSKEDLDWALKNSWFDPREATPVKILKIKIESID